MTCCFSIVGLPWPRLQRWTVGGETPTMFARSTFFRPLNRRSSPTMRETAVDRSAATAMPCPFEPVLQRSYPGASCGLPQVSRIGS